MFNFYTAHKYFALFVILCIMMAIIYKQAFKRKMFSPKYVWILPNWYSEDWWTKQKHGCTRDDMRMVLNNSLLYAPRGFFPLQSNSTDTISGTVSYQIIANTFNHYNLHECSQ